MSKHVCETYRAEIEEAAGGSALGHKLLEHLSACQSCEQFRRERASLDRLLGELGRVSAPADFEFRLRARLAAAEAARPGRSALSLRFVPSIASVAVAACFLAFSAWMFLRNEPAPTSRSESASHVSTPAPAAFSESAGDKAAVSDAASEQTEVRELASEAPRRTASVRSASNIRNSGRGTERSDVNIATFDSRPAPILNATPEPESVPAPSTAVALRTGSMPLQVVLRDERGAARVVPMRSVSFGLQELVRQGRNSAVPVSYTDSKEGVW